MKESLSLRKFQSEVASWHSAHFPGAPTTRVVLKVLEEIGELAQAENRMFDAIGADRTVWKHKRLDAIGDIVICLAVLCEKSNVDLDTIIQETWKGVQARSEKRAGGEVGDEGE